MASRNTYASTGTAGALNAAVTLPCAEADHVVASVTGTFTGTLTFEGSLDGTNWFAVTGNALSNTSSTTNVATTTTAGAFRFNTVGIQQLRLRMSAYTSGTATVTASTLVRR